MSKSSDPGRHAILCLGSPVIDIIVNVDKKFIEKYNLLPNNAIRALPQHEQLFEEITHLNPVYRVGGSVTNTVRIIQSISKIGSVVVYSGAIGKDNNGTFIKNMLARENICFKLKEIEWTGTGKCAVLLNENSRSMVTDLGAADSYRTSDAEEIWDIVEESKCLYLSAFFITATFEGLQYLFKKHYFVKGKTIAINLGAPFLCEKLRAEVMFLFKSADLVFGNEAEFRKLATVNKIYGENLKDVIIKLHDAFKGKPRILLVTRGSQNVFVLSNSEIQEYEVERLEDKLVVDTCGAGDAFAGGVLIEFIQNKPLDECVRRGIWAARQTVQHFGCYIDRKSEL